MKFSIYQKSRNQTFSLKWSNLDFRLVIKLKYLVDTGIIIIYDAIWTAQSPKWEREKATL